MSPITVTRNDLPKVSAAMSDELDKGVTEMGDALSELFASTVWKRTGLIARVTTSRDKGPFTVEVAVGWYLGQGFYSGFQEFGTVNQGARPVVRPGAHMMEPVFVEKITEALRRACAT
jgi:HK97 gp10 family phage protein